MNKNKFKIILNLFYVVSILTICFISVIFVLCCFFTLLYIFIKFFYVARPPFEFQGRILR
jgi:hypothetical protein